MDEATATKIKVEIKNPHSSYNIESERKFELYYNVS